MNLGYAVSFIFEDRKWVGKIAILTVFSMLSLSSIFVVGLAAVAVALGFMIQLAANVRNGIVRPLPAWNDYVEKFTLGGQVLMAIIVYNLPLLIIGSCSSILFNGLGNGLFGQSIALMTTCCALPFMLIYTILAWPMLATGMADFIETGQATTFYRPAHLWDIMRNHSDSVMQWALYTVLVNIALSILLLIPCIGWLAILMFGFPVHGHLLGQYAHQLHIPHEAKQKKGKRSPA